jgi:hypothetical protein
VPVQLTLAAGNYLNSGGKNARAPAAGFKIESMLKVRNKSIFFFICYWILLLFLRC